MLRGATQPVRMPCVSVCGNFFPTPPPARRRDNLPLGILVIIENASLNVTQSSILLISCVVCNVVLLFNHTLKIDGQWNIRVKIIQ